MYLHVLESHLTVL